MLAWLLQDYTTYTYVVLSKVPSKVIPEVFVPYVYVLYCTSVLPVVPHKVLYEVQQLGRSCADVHISCLYEGTVHV
jgi:hypothetical protein